VVLVDEELFLAVHAPLRDEPIWYSGATQLMLSDPYVFIRTYAFRDVAPEAFDRIIGEVAADARRAYDDVEVLPLVLDAPEPLRATVIVGESRTSWFAPRSGHTPTLTHFGRVFVYRPSTARLFRVEISNHGFINAYSYHAFRAEVRELAPALRVGAP
jgi:hypothetical protein